MVFTVFQNKLRLNLVGLLKCYLAFVRFKYYNNKEDLGTILQESKAPNNLLDGLTHK